MRENRPNIVQTSFPNTKIVQASFHIKLKSSVRRIASQGSYISLSAAAMTNQLGDETLNTQITEDMNGLAATIAEEEAHKVNGHGSDGLMQACVKCGSPCQVTSGSILRQSGLQCGQCTNVHQMLYRHLGGLPPGLVKLDAEQQKEFFKNASHTMQNVVCKGGRWKLVRASLVNHIASIRQKQVTNRVTEDWFPLSVWKTKGFNTDDIQKKGYKCEDAIFGEVWCAPLYSVLTDDIRSEVEKEISEREHALKKAKAPKGKAASKPPQKRPAEGAPADEDDCIDIDSEVWSIPSDDEPAIIIKDNGKKAKTAAKAKTGPNPEIKKQRDIRPMLAVCPLTVKHAGWLQRCARLLPKCLNICSFAERCARWTCHSHNLLRPGDCQGLATGGRQSHQGHRHSRGPV